jgi:phosphoglucosamine mutase
LSELANLLEPYPQVLLNVPVGRKIPFDQVGPVAQAVGECEAALAGRGRVLLRYSGTEPLARVMVEGQEASQVQVLAERLADLLRRHLA